MDFEIIIWIVFIIGSLIFSAVKKVREKQKQFNDYHNPNSNSSVKPQSPNAVGLEALLQHVRDQQPAKPKPRKVESHRPVVPKDPEVKVEAKTSQPLPEEGQRVTKKKVAANTKPDQHKRADGLHDKETLKKMIIYGQILAPKFD